MRLGWKPLTGIGWLRRAAIHTLRRAWLKSKSVRRVATRRKRSRHRDESVADKKRGLGMKRLLLRRWFLAMSLLALGAVDLPAVAGTPWWGTPPDPFNTEGVIRKDTPGLTDPVGRQCSVPGADLTFQAAVSLALCRNPQTRAAWVAAHQQAAVLGSAESAWLPTISATGQEARQFGAHANVNGEIVSTDQNNTDATVNLTWTLYDFGNRTGRIHSAHSLLDALVYTASRAVQQTVGTVVQAYYGVVADDLLVVSAKKTEEVTKQ